MRLARIKFELTNQDSLDGKNFTVLTSIHVNRTDIEIGLLFSLEVARNGHKKVLTFPEAISDWKK